jgi:hypothetical protein
MINSDNDTKPTAAHDEEVDRIVASGPVGALTVAGIATATVILMWVLFYALVFVPRGGGQ